MGDAVVGHFKATGRKQSGPRTSSTSGECDSLKDKASFKRLNSGTMRVMCVRDVCFAALKSLALLALCREPLCQNAKTIKENN